MTKFTNKNICSVCERLFNSHMPTTTRCSGCIACHKRRCKFCRKTFISKKKARYCSSRCSHVDNSRPQKFYVYGWYAPGDHLPYYIGKGSNNRAWRKVSRCDKEIRIYRDGLEEREAFIVETVLIAVFKSLGAKLTNKRDKSR